MIRTIGAICLSAALLVSLYGCGGKEPGPDNPKPPQAGQPEHPEETEHPKEAENPAQEKPKDHPAH